MGCWNGTCGISQLPIMVGDNVWAFLIGAHWIKSDGGDQSGYCYPTDLGFPMSLPIYGQYDGYGRIENIEENYNTKLLFEAYGNGYKNVKDFLDCAERDQVFLENNYIGRYGVGLFMVLADVMENLKIAQCDYEEHSVYNIFKTDAKYFFEDAKTFFTELELVDSKLSNGMFFSELSFCSNKYKSVNGYYNFFTNRFSGNGGAGGPIVDAWKPYRDYIIELVKSDKNIDDFEIRDFIEDAANLEILNTSMYALRKSWAPQCGKGNQSEELDFYWKLTSSIRKIINKRLKTNES